MPTIFISFQGDNAIEVRKAIADFLGQAPPVELPADPEMARDAETLSDKEYDAKYDPNEPKPEFPSDEPPAAVTTGKPNGGASSPEASPSAPPEPAPAKRGRPPKTPAPPPPMPSFIAIRDAIVDAFKKQEPKGIRAAAEEMRKKAGYDRIMAMPDTPELQNVLWEFCQTQGIEVV